MTGLRISDILNLTWDEIVLGADNGYCLRLKTEKTDTETTLPSALKHRIMRRTR